MEYKEVIKRKCHRCHHLIDQKVWFFIDASKDSKIKEKILDGIFFYETCDQCGFKSLYEYPVIYYDKRHHSIIFYNVDGCFDNYDILYKEVKRLTDLDESKYLMMQKRVVDTINQFHEKVVILENDMDDRIIEIGKLGLFHQLQDDYPIERLLKDGSDLPETDFSITEDKFNIRYISEKDLEINVDKNVYAHWVDDCSRFIDHLDENVYKVDYQWANQIYMLQTGYQIVDYQCDICGYMQKIICFTRIYGDMDPEIKDMLLNDKLFLRTCPNCHANYDLVYPLIYIDGQHKAVICFSYNYDNIMDFMIYCNENRLDDYKTRFVNNGYALIEKANAFHHGYDDHVFEIIKPFLFVKDHDTYPIVRDQFCFEYEGHVYVQVTTESGYMMPVLKEVYDKIYEEIQEDINNEDLLVDQNWANIYLDSEKMDHFLDLINKIEKDCFGT